MIPNRKLYKIGHLTQILKVTHRTIRYYDQMGLLPHIKRSDGGMRLFDDEDIAIIKKIREIQKNEDVALDDIKERLFKSSYSVTKPSVVITDSYTTLPEKLLNNELVRVIPGIITLGNSKISTEKPYKTASLWEKSKAEGKCPENNEPDASDIKALFNAIKKEGYEVAYVVLTGSNFANVVEPVKKITSQIKGIDIHIIDTKAVGPGVGLFVEQIVDAIEAKDSEEEISHLIAKQKKLIYTLGIEGNISYLLTGHQLKKASTCQAKLFQSLLSFYPIFTIKDGTGETIVNSCLPNKQDAIQLFLELLDHEFMLRGKYINRFMIAYSGLKTDAEKIYNQCQEKFSNSHGYLCEFTAASSVEFGPDCVLISII